MIKISLSNSEKQAILEIRRKTNDPRNERALAVLLNHEGKSAKDIANLLKRHYNTITAWLRNFKLKRLEGLNRAYSPGRPSQRKKVVIPLIEECLSHSPQDYGYAEYTWSTRLIQRYCYDKLGIKFSIDTIERSLHDAGYSYKRPQKSVPKKALSSEEKKKEVLKLIEEIRLLLEGGEAEVFALDESHFSTEPYIIRGWYKKGKPFFPADIQQKRRNQHIWSIQSSEQTFLLEKVVER